MPERFEKKFVVCYADRELELNYKDVGEVEDFIQSEKDLSKKEGQEEYKQFILNILDGIDIADGECNTKAIRLAINSRVI